MICLFVFFFVVSYAEIIFGESRYTVVSYIRYRIRVELFIYAYRRFYYYVELAVTYGIFMLAGIVVTGKLAIFVFCIVEWSFCCINIINGDWLVDNLIIIFVICVGNMRIVKVVCFVDISVLFNCDWVILSLFRIVRSFLESFLYILGESIFLVFVLLSCFCCFIRRLKVVSIGLSWVIRRCKVIICLLCVFVVFRFVWVFSVSFRRVFCIFRL